MPKSIAKMKNKGYILLLLLFLTGCFSSKPTETLLLKCQKLRNYEYYNGTNIVGLYGTDEKHITMAEMVESYTPKWDDVDMDILKENLEKQKEEYEKKYENITFVIDEIKRNITIDIKIPLTKQNLVQMKNDDNYQSAIENETFMLSLYKQTLEENAYICQ